MIKFGSLSITLLIGAAQGVVLAVMLLCVPHNRVANRFLAALIVAVALMVTPYIIGFAGFYDAYPWLSFAPFGTSLAFGPLFWCYAFALTSGAAPARWWLHFLPYLVQFLSQAAVFPLPLEWKNWWDGIAHAPIISPLLTAASLVSITLYGWLVWRRYGAYCRFLESTRSDGARFDPSWLRNALIALMAMGAAWAGFVLADALDPSRDYFDRFWMYVALSALSVYLGVEGWRNASLPYPILGEAVPKDGLAAVPERDWRAQGEVWAREVDTKRLWQDPEITLASMAKALGTNTSYASRALNEGLGVSFSAFINSRRVEAVKAVLAQPDAERDLMAIAFEAGFNSKASFNRAFSDFAGMSPSAYRKMARGP